MAGEGVLAGLVPPVPPGVHGEGGGVRPPVLHVEGGALVPQGVHAHLRVDVQLGGRR